MPITQSILDEIKIGGTAATKKIKELKKESLSFGEKSKLVQAARKQARDEFKLGLEPTTASFGQLKQTLPFQEQRNVFFQQPNTFDAIVKQKLLEKFDPQKKAALARLGSIEQQLLGGLDITGTPGFAKFLPQDVSRALDLEQQGLGSQLSILDIGQRGRQKRIEDIGQTLGSIYSEQGRTQALRTQNLQSELQRRGAQQEKLDARREAATREFVNLRQQLAAKGVPLSMEAGREFMTAIQTSNNPEIILDQYTATAYAQPKVKAALAPKRTGDGPIKDDTAKKMKQAVDLANSLVNSGIWTDIEGKAYVTQFMNQGEQTADQTAALQQQILDDPSSAIEQARAAGDSDVIIVNDLIVAGMSPKEAANAVGINIPGVNEAWFSQTPSGNSVLFEKLFRKKEKSSKNPEAFLSAPK